MEESFADFFSNSTSNTFAIGFPPTLFTWSGHMSWMNESGSCHRERRLIKIASGPPDEDMISTLLHEMAHAETGDGHGLRFKKAMIRLRQAGAPLTDAELNVPPDGWDGRKVSQARFRGVVQDFLINVPAGTLQQVIRGFIYKYRGPATSIKDFLRRYSWARRVFQKAQKERAEYERLR